MPAPGIMRMRISDAARETRFGAEAALALRRRIVPMNENRINEENTKGEEEKEKETAKHPRLTIEVPTNLRGGVPCSGRCFCIVPTCATKHPSCA